MYESTRDDFEKVIIDEIRFEHADAYLDSRTHHYFKDEQLKKLFVQIFYNRPNNVVEILDAAVAASGNSHRLQAVREAVLTKWVRDGKLTGI